ASEGLAKFSNLLRSNQDSGVLFDLLISDVTQYIKANQGALFIVDNEQEETVIELKSCYAYNRKKFFEKSIKPGQGLVGQAYFEKDIIYLKDIPQDYLRITSGLGEALPTSALVIPLIVNESVEGFFELAAFQEFEEHEIEFLKNLGENVASFISINRINEKTKYLLEETQQQTEQMKSQEEEMRQNMEELQATQEEMQRKEKEYINRINELERTLEEVTQKI
ncbi:MAG: GAF domain-containing protein, partial [Bacteroidota bacterium]